MHHPSPSSVPQMASGRRRPGGDKGAHTHVRPVPSAGNPALHPIAPVKPASGHGDRHARTAPGPGLRTAGLMSGLQELRKQGEPGMRSHDMWPSRGGGGGGGQDNGASPYFLKEIEAYLDRELGVLVNGLGQRDGQKSLWREVSDAPDVSISRIFCHAFKMFAQSSRIYGPLLMSIYQKFANMIDAHEELQMNHNVLVREADAVRMSFEERCNAMAVGYHKEKEDLAHRNEALQTRSDEQVRIIDELTAKCAEVKRIEKMYTDKWYEERERVLVMVNQIREAEEQHQETQIQFDKLKRDTMGVQELMKLYQNTADELTQLREDYKENVPAKQFQMIVRQSQEKSDKMLQMKITFAGLRKKIEALERQVGKLEDTVKGLEDDNARLRGEKGCDTPRPEWEAIIQEHDIEMTLDATSSTAFARALAGRLVREAEKMATQDRDIQALKEQLQSLGIDDASVQQKEAQVEYFVGLGTGKEVPKYLKWFGQIPNRMLSKREVEGFLKDFWTARRKDLETSGKDSQKKVKLERIEDFLFTHLKSKHGTQAKLADRAYNVLGACRKFQHDGDCELFLCIIEGHLPEQVYYEQMRMLEKLQAKMEELEVPGPTGKRSGKVRKNKVLMLLDKFFLTKSDVNITRLKALLSNHPGDDVHVAQLFAEDKDGNQTQFVETMRNQMVKEHLEYYQVISNAIFLKSSDKYGSSEGDVCVTLTAVKDAILEVDPHKSAKEVERMITLGLGMPEGSLFELTTVTSLQPFLANLMKGHIQRHTKPVEKDAKG